MVQCYRGEPQGNKPVGFFVCHKTQQNPRKPNKTQTKPNANRKEAQKPMRKAFNDPVEFADKVEQYFAKCAASRTERELKNGDIRVRQEIPSFVGLAVFLGVVKSTLTLYGEGQYDLTNDELKEIAEQRKVKLEDIQNYSTTLSRARDRFELAVLEAGSNGDCDSRVIQARLAGYGYSSKVEVDSKATLTVQWEGVDTDSVRAWGG